LALPLCGWGARGKPWRWLLWGQRRVRIYPRYPRYPHADSAWTDSLFMTANGGGRDDLPATGESLPSHSLSQSQAGRLRVAGRVEAKGRAADEAAARRKLRACPLADAKAAGFESAHGFQAAFGHVGDHPGGTPDLRVQDQPGGKRDFGPLRRHRRRKRFGAGFAGQDRVSARELRNRRTQDFGPWPSGGTRGFGRGSRHHRNQSFGRGTAMGGRGT
jgi:hypothetical protein